MANPPVPFLNRLVDQMFPHADPKADQNIWDLARAAEEVMRADNVDRFFKTGDPAELGGYQPSPEQVNRVVGPFEVGWRRGDGGRVQMNQVPVSLGPPQPNYTEALTEIAKLKKKLSVAEDVINQIRGALDPDNQFEDESLIVLARERMNQRAARGNTIKELRQQIGTEIEPVSAEHLRRVLGATKDETLGQAAKRVAESAKSGWKQYEAICTETRKFEDKIRELVGAQPEVDDWDNPRNAQPTLDAVRRLVLAFFELSKASEKDKLHAEISPESAYREKFLRNAQGTWDGINEMKPLPGEKP